MTTIIDSPANWQRADIEHRTDEWIHQLSQDEIAEIEAALHTAKSRGKTFDTLTKEDFPLSRVGDLLQTTLHDLENGLGLKVLRGFPALEHTKDDMRLIYWGLGKHLGTAVSQSFRGDILGDVKNLNIDVNSPRGRGYTTNQRLNFHTDSCDVVALMVLRAAKSGGMSLIASSVAIHNEIARTRPDLLEVLYQPFYWSWQGQEAPGELPYYQQPIFTMHEGHFACRYISAHIRSAQRFDDVPRLTEAQTEALELLTGLANDPKFHLAMMFEPGDVQLLNNHVTLHARTEFEDYEEEDQRRHLIRMWLSVPNSRPLSPALGTIYRDRRPGAVRGGFPSRTGKHQYYTTGGLQD